MHGNHKGRLVAQIQLLDDCNLRCRHCYVGINRFFPREMPKTEVIKSWIDNISNFAQEACFERIAIHFAGGEPLCRDDIVELVEYCFSKKISPFILTNGSLFNKDLGEKLKKAGLNYIQFSIEGPEEINDSIRGKGVYKKVMESVQISKELGIKPTLSITLSQQNIKYMKSFIKKLDILDVLFRTRELIAIGDGKHIDTITPEQRKDFFEFLKKYDGKSRLRSEDPIQCSIENGKIRKGGCVAMREHFCIDVDGSVFPCRLFPMKTGTVDDLGKAYNSDVATKLRNRELKGKCSGCRLIENCGGCRAYSYLKDGDPLGEDSRCLLIA